MVCCFEKPSRPITLLCLTLGLIYGVPSSSIVLKRFFTHTLGCPNTRLLPLWSRPKRNGDIVDSAQNDLPLIYGLLEKANIDPTQAQIKPLGDSSSDNQAFCNRLYRIHYQLDTNSKDNQIKSPTVVAKIFSELAIARMTHTVGELDTIIGAAGIGPNVLSSLHAAILMEDCNGKVLTERDVHLDKNEHLLEQCAQTLAKLHDLRPCAGHEANVLFHSCNIMLSCIPVDWSLSLDSYWTRSRLASCLDQHKLLLESTDSKMPEFSATSATKTQLEMTGSGHGDCKPSNIILLPCENKHQNVSVKLIDLELAGKHYRAYDLAKFWRTSKYLTSSLARKQDLEKRRHFLEAYYHYSSSLTATLPELEQQVDLMVPLTWLEAAIFFASMESARENPPEQEKAWANLTADRLQNYEKSMEKL